MLRWPPKDPDEILDYTIQWGNRLQSDTISASTWFVPVTITKESDSFTGKTTTIWLSGGAVSQTPLVITNRITTSNNRVMEQSVNLTVQDK